MKKGLQITMAVLLLLLSGCNHKSNMKEVQAVSKQVNVNKLEEGPQFARMEDVAKWKRTIDNSKDLKPEEDQEDIDIRFTDVSTLDFTKVSIDHLTFDNHTKWPDTLPSNYDLNKIMELGKDPGLGVRALHKQGVTGKGTQIAIIDQALLLDHDEYNGKIKLYELLNSYDEYATMHGAAVTSIAVGNEIGVAPDADIYYISCNFFDVDKERQQNVLNLSYMAKGIRRVIEINKELPEDEKIDVLSISRGFSKEENPDVYDAIEEAKEAGIFVITTSLRENYEYELFGLTRSAFDDPNDALNYRYATWGSESYLRNQDVLFAPMDHRTTAGPLGKDNYAHYSSGGLSWTVPWLAGMFALCRQIDPELSGEEFLEAAAMSGDTYDFGDEDNYEFYHEIINPYRLIEYIKEQKRSETEE